MNTPLVCFGLPIYNAANYLDLCLKALCEQTFSDFEILISDNASTDRSEEICQQWCRKDSRIRYVKQPVNRGAIWNHNEVFRLSNAEYFKWMGHDDVYEKQWLEKAVHVLQNNPDVIWCQSLTMHIDGEGNVIPAEQDIAIPTGETSHSMLFAGNGLPSVTRASKNAYERFHSVILGTTWCSDSYGLIRSEALKKTNLFPQCYGPEKVLIAELALYGKYAEVPEVLFYKRTHEQASGKIEDRTKKKKFVHGNHSSKLSWDRLVLLKGYYSAIMNSELRFAEKVRCLGSIVQYLFQFKKYKRLLFGSSPKAAKNQKKQQLKAT